MIHSVEKETNYRTMTRFENKSEVLKYTPAMHANKAKQYVKSKVKCFKILSRK